MIATTAYLDASAAVKLLRPEPETPALRGVLAAIAGYVSSELLEIELRCVAHREGGGELIERAEGVCAAIDLLPCTSAVRARAGGAFDPPQRALDALHLATALDLRLGALVLVTYDKRQAQAGRAAGLEVVAPT
ncbi:MAG: type II toxin-antitoxin system VapC family toxin [Solirubrobacteraceae bacterium]